MIWSMILAGELRTVMVGDRHRVIYSDLEAFISNLGGERLEDILDKGRLRVERQGLPSRRRRYSKIWPARTWRARCSR